MNQLKKVDLLIFVSTIISAMNSGCTTGPKTKSTSGKNHEIENEKIKEP
jgi:hypothetical protein